MLNWDNTARRGVNGTVVHHGTPLEYRKWLIALVDEAVRRPVAERLIFINAWNEWAEGTHLEPDLEFGRGYLEATRDAMAINC
jgi:lipopolysaccharide biosynthesis protein